MAEVLSFQGITLLNEDERAVFRHLDWGLPANGRVCLHTAPGSGASALLRLAAGLAHPQEGSVCLDGVALGPYTFDHPFLKRGGIGWVPTEGGLQANLSLAANAALPLRFLRGHSRAEADRLAREHLELAGLGTRVDLRPHALEPRERWMGALVRAALTNPSLWLVDQPPGALEPRERRLAESILEEAMKHADAAFLVVGGEWKESIPEVFHLHEGHLVPGGL